MAEDRNKLEKLFYEVNVALGGTGIEVELEHDDFTFAFDEAVRVYRSMTTNSVRLGWALLRLEASKQSYTLPSEVDNVRRVQRSRSRFGISDQMDPFVNAYIQSMMGATGSGPEFANLATYDFTLQYQETIGRMFGETLIHRYDEDSNTLTIMNIVRYDEVAAVECAFLKSTDQLLAGGSSYRWLRRFTEAECRMILGEKYRKYANAPGAQGGIQLKGNELVKDGLDMREKLEKELLDYVDGGRPPIPIIG